MYWRNKIEDYFLELSKGRVVGGSFFALGERETIGETVAGEDIWRGTATTMPNPADAGEQMTVISTSANDAAAGTGIRTTELHYLDNNGDEQEEIVTLNGATGVDTVATNIRFVNDFYALTVGSNGVAMGDITIYKKGASSTIYNMIKTGGNMSLVARKMVPSGKTYYLTGWEASVIGDKPVFIRIRSTDHHGILIPGVYLFKDVVALVGGGSYVKHFAVPKKIPSLSIAKITGWATADGVASSVSASFDGVLLPN